METFLVSSLALCVMASLFILRGLDDNSLIRWPWVFAQTAPASLFGILGAGIIGAYLVARLPIAARHSPLLLFIASFASAAVFWPEPEVLVDASRYFTQAKHLEVYGIGYFFLEWGREISAWTDLPLVPFLYGLIFKFCGESRVYIQIFNTLLFSATVILTYGIGRTLWSEEMGATAGALLLGIPYLLTQVPSMLADVPTMFFFTLAVYAFVQALHSGGTRRIVLASLALFLAFFSKYSTWPLLSVLLIVQFVHLRRNVQGARLRGSMIGLISGLLIAGTIAAKYDVLSEQIALLLSYQVPGLRRWGESPVSTFLFQIHPLLTAAALYSVYAALKEKDWRYAILAWPLLLMVLLQVNRIRYMIPVFPMLALMASYGLQSLRSSREVKKFAAACAVVSSLAIAFWGYLPFVQRFSSVNLKAAGEYLDTIPEERVEVFALAQRDSRVNPAVSVPILDLFTRKDVSYRGEATPSAPVHQVEQSALRFTWEHRNPRYYATEPEGREGNRAVVVISHDVDQALEEEIQERVRGYRLSRVFDTYEGAFRYKTMVRVYQLLGPNP
jgi:hypothetical protein